MYLIKNVTLYDPMLRGTCNLLISGEQIVAVGKDLQPAIPGIKADFNRVYRNFRCHLLSKQGLLL